MTSTVMVTAGTTVATGRATGVGKGIKVATGVDGSPGRATKVATRAGVATWATVATTVGPSGGLAASNGARTTAGTRNPPLKLKLSCEPLQNEFVGAVIGAMDSNIDLSTQILNSSEISQKLMGELVPIIYKALKAAG